MPRMHPLLALALLLTAPVAQAQPAHPPAAVPVLFLSDIHFNPFADPALTAQFAGRPVVAPLSPAVADAQSSCATLDTPTALFQSSLTAAHLRAAPIRFVTVTGDLLSHQFIRCFAAFVLNTPPAGSDEDQYKAFSSTPGGTLDLYRSFVQKTIEYVAGQLQQALPGVPIYFALGNNDTACGDYDIDPNDALLKNTAYLVAASAHGTRAADIPLDARANPTAPFNPNGDYQFLGDYNIPIPALPTTHLIVLDDLFLSASHLTCSGQPEPESTAKAQKKWLNDQLDAASAAHQKVWVMGHIPPGLDPYTTLRKRAITYFLSPDITSDLASHSPDVRLALFAHTHFDSLSEISPANPKDPPITLKLVQSICPNHGNPPSITIAHVDPRTARLIDYTVIMAAQAAPGAPYTWPAATLPAPPPTWSATPAAQQ